MTDWRITNMTTRHPTHGLFSVLVFGDGTANASRIYGEHPRTVEDVGPRELSYPTMAAAVLACELRIAELDAELLAAHELVRRAS
jgi:hypothetical protein